jgi:membrane-bound lytic murein transglycosylase D
VVRSGENIVTIADKYGVTAREVRRWNGLGSNNVAAGKRLRLYVNNGGVAFAQNTNANPAPAPAAASKPKTQQQAPAASASGKGYVTYKVKAGDSLYSISRRYPGVSVDALQKANNLPNTNIRSGQILKIPVG